MNDPKQERNRLLGEAVVAALRSRHFGAQYCETVAAARALIPEGASVTFGGSMTIRDTGLVASLKAGNYRVFDRDEIPPAERGAFMEAHYFSDFFLLL